VQSIIKGGMGGFKNKERNEFWKKKIKKRIAVNLSDNKGQLTSEKLF
jgi:hypothetical protein